MRDAWGKEGRTDGKEGRKTVRNKGTSGGKERAKQRCTEGFVGKIGREVEVKLARERVGEKDLK